jgi:hypothetical protein
MLTSKIYPIAFFLLTSTGTAMAEKSAEQWKAYICRATDWAACEQGKKRIYPKVETYKSEDACYEKFEILFEEDPEISKKYPQTETLAGSHVFECEQVDSPDQPI